MKNLTSLLLLSVAVLGCWPIWRNLYVMQEISAGSAQLYRNTMRSVFHLPEDVTFLDFRSPLTGKTEPVCHAYSVAQGVVQFSEEEYKAYRASLRDKALWQTQTIPYYSRAPKDYHYTTDALQWHALPYPAKTGNQELKWQDLKRNVWQQIRDANNNSIRSLEQITNGHYLCMGIELNPPEAWRVHRNYPSPTFSIAPCDAYADTPRKPDQPSSPASHILGVLDDDSHRLYMTMQFAGPSYPCRELTKRNAEW